MTKLTKKLADPLHWYFLILVLALPAGLFFAKQLSFLADASTILLGIIFFLGALKIERQDFKKIWRSKLIILTFTLLMLIDLPVVVYLFALLFVPNYALALLILAAMPVGMATPLMTDIIGGRPGLAMAMTVVTSLLAPFTIPLVINTLAGTNVSINFWQMFLSISEIIFIPFGLAWLTRHFFPNTIAKTKDKLGHISTAILGLLIAGIVAQQASAIVKSLVSSELFASLAVVTVLMAVFYGLGYLIYANQKGKDRLTLTISFANMNFTLAIVLAHKYFAQANIIVPITLAVVPWFVFIIIFKYLTKNKAEFKK